MISITIPSLGESITEAIIDKWNLNDGDMVQTGDILCDLGTDKATSELPSEVDGRLHIKAEEGQTVSVGDVIAEIESINNSTNSTNIRTEVTEDTQNTEAVLEAVLESGLESGLESNLEPSQVTIPSLGESISEATLGTWVKQDGEYVEEGDVICELETEKAASDIEAEISGTLSVLAKEGDNLEVGAVIAVIEPTAKQTTKQTTKQITKQEVSVEEKAESSEAKSYAEQHPSPAAAKILREKGIDPQSVKGTGVGNRITKADAEKAQVSATKQEKIQEQELKVSPQKGGRRTDVQAMSSLRKTVARRLVDVKNQTAMLTTFNEVNMEPIMSLRKKYKDMFKEKHEVGLGFMSFFIKASCLALQEWKAVNARIEENNMIFHDYCDVSIAVSAPRGLVVPVIRNAEQMSFDEIEKEVVRLAKKARANKLSIDEMQGGTFTITNGGVFGSMLSTPIINAPQSAILGMHNIVERPIAENGQVVIKPIMYLALSYDHRIIDGRESVSFLYRIKELLEDPMRIVLGV